MQAAYTIASTEPLPVLSSVVAGHPLEAIDAQPRVQAFTTLPASTSQHNVAQHQQSAFSGNVSDDSPANRAQLSNGAARVAKLSSSAVDSSLEGVTQVADKSCHRCRIRKVKCDRRWPKCNKCSRRQEKCEWSEDVTLALQIGQSRSSKPTARSNVGLNTPSISKSLQPQTRTWPLTPAATHGTSDLKTLWDSFMSTNIGERSVDWQLARPAMASSLSLHLLEASQHSCCFHLPAFHTFSNRIGHLKTNLTRLDIQGEVIVAVLASLGARASPHSALIGVAGPDLNIEKVKAPRDFVLTAGTRRENAWRALADRAVDLCSRSEILQRPSKDNIEILVACIQMLMLSKVRPIKSRFFLRNVTGMFEDIQRMDVPLSEILSIKRSVGRTLYECDARVAAYSNSPLFITDADIQELFHGTGSYQSIVSHVKSSTELLVLSAGIVLPDLARDSLAEALDQVFDGPLTPKQVEDALALTGYWVCALQRTYARISSARTPNMDFHQSVPQLWKWIDNAHTAVQSLHRRLVHLQNQQPRVNGSDHDLEFDLLIAVRMDNRLIDLVNLAHEFLRSQFDRPLSDAQHAALSNLFALSDQRVRKCLKLSAFYSKVYIDSRDKHVIYHLVVQLDALPTWALLAPQKAGEPTAAGPLAPECELSEVELDWLTSALELACYYTPLAAERLEELSAGRAARGRPAPPQDRTCESGEVFDLLVSLLKQLYGIDSPDLTVPASTTLGNGYHLDFSDEYPTTLITRHDGPTISELENSPPIAPVSISVHHSSEALHHHEVLAHETSAGYSVKHATTMSSSAAPSYLFDVYGNAMYDTHVMPDNHDVATLMPPPPSPSSFVDQSQSWYLDAASYSLPRHFVEAHSNNVVDPHLNGGSGVMATNRIGESWNGTM
ncbi:hypothetical protein OIO90_005442 [Microbotryomycetes sp. JL221]|nr:hypothetical protein OIO90_005442 [Microbotryomycetes sp. JL221]